MIRIILAFVLSSYCFSFAEEQWIQKHYVKYESMKHITCPDSAHCYAFTHRALDFENNIFLSTDQGATWELFYAAPFEDNVHDFKKVGESWAVDSMNIIMTYIEGFAVDWTKDGGETFNRTIFEVEERENKGWLLYTAMYDANYGAIVSTFEIIYTKDGWENYKVFKFHKDPRWPIANCFYFLDSVNVIIPVATTTRDSLMKFNMNTEEFSLFYCLEPVEGEKLAPHIMGVDFVDDTLGYACGYRKVSDSVHWGTDVIWKTIDGGHSWNIILDSTIYHTSGVTNITATDDGRIFAAGNTGKAIESTDGGLTWTYLETPNYPDHPEYPMFDLWVNCEYAGQYKLVSSIGVGIWRYEDPSSVRDSTLLHGLLTIRPNPARSNVSISLPPGHFIDRVELFNSEGRRVLLSDQGPAYTADSSINIEGLPPGIYIVQVHSGGKMFTGRLVRE